MLFQGRDQIHANVIPPHQSRLLWRPGEIQFDLFRLALAAWAGWNFSFSKSARITNTVTWIPAATIRYTTSSEA